MNLTPIAGRTWALAALALLAVGVIGSQLLPRTAARGCRLLDLAAAFAANTRRGLGSTAISTCVLSGAFALVASHCEISLVPLPFTRMTCCRISARAGRTVGQPHAGHQHNGDERDNCHFSPFCKCARRASFQHRAVTRASFTSDRRMDPARTLRFNSGQLHIPLRRHEQSRENQRSETRANQTKPGVNPTTAAPALRANRLTPPVDYFSPIARIRRSNSPRASVAGSSSSTRR